MGKTIFGYITWTIAVVAVVYWFMAEPGVVENGDGWAIPITISGVYALIYSFWRFLRFLINEWD